MYEGAGQLSNAKRVLGSPVGECSVPLAPIQARQNELSLEIGKLGGALEELERRTEPVRIQSNQCEPSGSEKSPEPAYAPIEYTVADDIRRIRTQQRLVERLLGELRI